MELITLDKILTYQKGKPPQKTNFSNDVIIILTPEYLRGSGSPEYVNFSKNLLLTENDEILLLWDGSNAGEFFLSKEGAVASTMVKFFIRDNKIDKKYLFYSLKVLESILKSNTSGSGIPHVDKSLFYSHTIFKFDIKEQAKIAEILTEIDEAISKTEALIEKYKSIKTGLMQDLLSKGIDADGKIRSFETHPFKDSPIGKIPLEWEIKTLNDCINPNTIITYGIVQTGKNVEDGIRVLRTIDLKEDYIDTDNLLKTSPEISNSYKRTLLKENDIVCNVRASVGDFNIVTKDLEGCNLTRGVARISLLNSINPFFILLFLRSEANKKQMELLIKGTTFIDINISDLRNIKIPVPKSIDEQNRIADTLLVYDGFIKKERGNLSKLQTTKTGLMQDLLSGKVRVTNLLNN